MTVIQHEFLNQLLEHLKQILEERQNKYKSVCANRLPSNVRVYLSFEITELASSKKTVPANRILILSKHQNKSSDLRNSATDSKHFSEI